MDWKSVVKTVAPTIGAALGGPMGGIAVKFLADQFLGNPDAKEQDVAEAVLNATPDKLLELRKLDNDFKIRMRELDIDVFKLEVQDKASARDLAKFNMKPHMILTVVYSIGYFGIMGAMLSGQVQFPVGQTELLSGLIGVLTAIQIKIADFWFGSSYGSKVKDAQ